LLATEGGRLKLAATNLEIGITHWTGAQVHAEGARRDGVELQDADPAPEMCAL
jgi:hypothetical protein